MVVWKWVMVNIKMGDCVVFDEVLDGMFWVVATVGGMAKSLMVGTILGGVIPGGWRVLWCDRCHWFQDSSPHQLGQCLG